MLQGHYQDLGVMAHDSNFLSNKQIRESGIRKLCPNYTNHADTPEADTRCTYTQKRLNSPNRNRP